jgi:hypothetical protein
MSLTYITFQSELANLAGTATTNAYFQIELPAAIDYAELRIQRDLNLLAAITTDSSQTCVPNKRIISIPSAFVGVDGINIVTPAGTTPDNGTRNELQKVSKDFMDFCWSSAAGAALPTKFAVLNQGTLLLGPWPDQGYVVEIIGPQRVTPLSASNATNFLSTNLPDLYLAAAMIHMAAYQKNFGAMADDPRSAMSWEMQYKLLLAGADAEEMRKRYAGTVRLAPGAKTPIQGG